MAWKGDNCKKVVEVDRNSRKKEASWSPDWAAAAAAAVVAAADNCTFAAAAAAAVVIEGDRIDTLSGRMRWLGRNQKEGEGCWNEYTVIYLMNSEHVYLACVCDNIELSLLSTFHGILRILFYVCGR